MSEEGRQAIVQLDKVCVPLVNHPGVARAFQTLHAHGIFDVVAHVAFGVGLELHAETRSAELLTESVRLRCLVHLCIGRAQEGVPITDTVGEPLLVSCPLEVVRCDKQLILVVSGRHGLRLEETLTRVPDGAVRAGCVEVVLLDVHGPDIAFETFSCLF